MVKGQLIGQAFIFILAALVFILIISYGYRSINYLLARQDEATMLDVKTDIETAVENVRHDFQSVRKVTLRLPAKYQGMCFFEYASWASVTHPVLRDGDREVLVDWAKDACSVGSANVFIVPRTRDLDLPDIQVASSQKYVCVPNNGGVVLRLEGTGRTVKVSAWT